MARQRRPPFVRRGFAFVAGNRTGEKTRVPCSSRNRTIVVACAREGRENNNVADNSQVNRTVLPAGSQVGRYIIDDVPAETDAFAISYHALDAESGEAVVLREFFPVEFVTREGTEVRPINDDARRSFNWGLRSFSDQAAGLRSVKHPGVVRIRDTLEANGTAYSVADPIPGTTLAAQLAGGRTLAADQLVPLADALADALAQAHAAGVIHGDIRPQTIVLRDDGTPVLTDFGAARFVIRFKFRSLASVLASGFAPPEAYLASARLEPTFDLYSLAATIYLAATGVTPADAQKRQRGEARLKPAGKATLAWYPNGFLDGVEWGLRLDPAARPQTLAQWRDAMAGRVAAPAAPPEESDEALAAAAAAKAAQKQTVETRAVLDPAAASAPAARKSNGALLGAIAIAAVAVIGGGVYFATRSDSGPAVTTAASGDDTVPAVDNASDGTPTRATPVTVAAASDRQITALDHLATELKSREAHAEAEANTAREQAAKAALAAQAARDAQERARLQKEADEAQAREKAAREEAARVKADVDKRLRDAEEARHKREQELLAQQAQQRAAQLKAEQQTARNIEQQAAQQAAPPAKTQLKVQELDRQTELAMRTSSVPPRSAAASPAPAAAAAPPGIPANLAMLSDRATAAPAPKPAAAAPAAAAAQDKSTAPLTGEQLSQLVALARKNCRLAAPDLTFSGDLTYQKAKTLSGARVDKDGAVVLPPMMLKDGRFQAIQVTPDNCAKIVHL
jgi:hypothetical protein